MAPDAMCSPFESPWNPRDWDGLRSVGVEDDFRDALQSTRVRRPTLAERAELLRATAAAGVRTTFLGFPAASAREAAMCAELLSVIDQEKLPLEPVLMSRAVLADLDSVIAIQDQTSVPVTADVYTAVSDIRLSVERRSFAEVSRQLQVVTKRALGLGLQVRVALEDSTRATLAALRGVVEPAFSAGVQDLVLNDTVGACVPAGARAHVASVLEMAHRLGASVEILWHGHNDRGLALANALAAAEAGATSISGTFLGEGERAGNIPLEQLLYILAEAGHPAADASQLVRVCELTARYLDIAVPSPQPIVGAGSFATATGTHAAAIVKARGAGVEIANAVYSSVNAGALQREQLIYLGPNSGTAAVVEVLSRELATCDPSLVALVLAECKRRDRCITTRGDLIELIAAAQLSERR